MYFGHAPEIWQAFPQLVPGVLVVDRIHAQIDVAPRLEPFFERARGRMEAGPESAMPEVAAWRRAYAQMGMKPTKYRSAAEALVRRFRREDELPRLHPLIDLCNAVSLAYALPVAVFDLAKIDQFLQVRRAQGTEQYHAFSGETETIRAGEVIFADAGDHAHARRWTFRQSRLSTVREKTSEALIVAEGLHDTAERDIHDLLNSIVSAVTDLWKAPRERTLLTARSPNLVFSDPIP
jgi:DNA/RNA-binding domain of Phe-tRNA-synthetase-like protein